MTTTKTTAKTTANGRGGGDIEELLPWHAAGTLDERDARRVEAALADDPDLARRYELVREELAQTIHLNETLGAPAARAMDALFAKIDAEPQRRPSLSKNLGARITELFAGRSPRVLAWSAVAAAVVIALQAGLIADGLLKKTRPGGYQTASAPANVAGEGSFALIRFKPQATAADIADFLETNKLNIVGGPSAGGLYRLRVAATKLPKADLAHIVSTLQNDKVIAFIAKAE